MRIDSRCFFIMSDCYFKTFATCYYVALSCLTCKLHGYIFSLTCIIPSLTYIRFPRKVFKTFKNSLDPLSLTPLISQVHRKETLADGWIYILHCEE